MTPPFETDIELLKLARQVLADSGYRVQDSMCDDIYYVIAEDTDNVVAVTAMLEGGDLIAVEPVLGRALIERLSDTRVGAKRWDGYVILLTSATPTSETSQGLFDLAYNLINVRRLIRVRVKPTIADVARSLRPVLPLTVAVSEAVLTDPLASLAERLRESLGTAAVSSAMTAFRASDPGDEFDREAIDSNRDELEAELDE